MIKRKLVIVLMLAILATCVAVPADAQFWKKKSQRKHRNKHKTEQTSTTTGEDKPLSRKEEKKLKKERKKKEKEERRQQKLDRRAKKHRRARVETESDNAPSVSVKNTEADYPLTKMKDRYRVHILAALYLDDLVKGESVTFKNKIPEKAEQALAFYEGVNIAADSLKKAGFKIDIYVHDIVSRKEMPSMLIAEGKLDSADLIIGDVLPQDVPVMAAFAAKKQINYISTTSVVEGGIANNAYYTLMLPSLKSHCEWIGGNIAVKYPRMDVTVLYRTTVQTDEDAHKFVMVDNMYHARYRQLSCNSLPSKARLSNMFDTTKPNIVIIPVLDPGYADSLLTLLASYFPSTHFEVYGMPSWSSMGDLHKKGTFPNMSISITSPFHVDPASVSAKYVARIYRKDYNSKAPELVYRGYEAMFWYANLLKRYGTIFNVKYEDNTTAPFTSFDIKPQLDKRGNILFYENKHVFLSRYEGGVNKTE